jgi:dienelactone hydrolase
MTSISCCTGFIDRGEPKGTIEEISGVSCYMSISNSEKCVIIATDVFGYTVPNVRLIADSFAEQGFTAIVPDLFKGGEIPPYLMNDLQVLSQGTLLQRLFILPKVLYYFPSFMWYNSIGKGVDVIRNVANELKPKFKQLFAVGYCWGGSINTKLSHEDLFNGICCAHPGQLSIPSDIDAIKTPLYFVLPDIDFLFSKESFHQIIHIMDAKGDQMRYKAEIYPNVEHGFAVRGNENDPLVKKQRELAFSNMVSFFNHL